MQNFKKYVNAAFSICFILAIVLPLLFADKGGERSEIENRRMAPFPRLIRENHTLNRTLVADISMWLEDNAGGRSAMSAIQTVIEYYIFGESGKKNTVRGKEDWLFAYDSSMLRDFQHKNEPTPEQLSKYVGVIASLHEYARGQGIPLIMIIIPDKKTAYAELYPNSIRQLERPSRSDILIKAWRDAGIDARPLLPALLEAKTTETVYSERLNTSHWNPYGAFIGYQEIMRAINQYIPAPMLTINDYDIFREENSLFFNGAIPISEMQYRFVRKTPSATTLDTSLFDQIPDMAYLNTEPTYKLRYTTPDISSPSVLYIGDSYFLDLQQFLKESARELTFLHVGKLNMAQTLIHEMKPDVIVFAIVERMLHNLLNYNE